MKWYSAKSCIAVWSILVEMFSMPCAHWPCILTHWLIEISGALLFIADSLPIMSVRMKWKKIYTVTCPTWQCKYTRTQMVTGEKMENLWCINVLTRQNFLSLQYMSTNKWHFYESLVELYLWYSYWLFKLCFWSLPLIGTYLGVNI